MSGVTRRQLLAAAGTAAVGGALVASGCGRHTAEAPPPAAAKRSQQPVETPSLGSSVYLAIARGPDPVAITKAAVAALGGMGAFVKKGQDVIVKPNICTDYHGPEYAATTNPEVVATLVSLALEAGAARVRVMDMPFGGTESNAYAVSGIGPAVAAAGGEMEIMSPSGFASFQIPDGRDITSWQFYRAVLETDVLINVPIAKTHGTTRLTLGGKNIMGVISDPGQIHSNISQRIADLVSLVRPSLTVVDAVRILTAGGPTGGDLGAVKKTDTVAASRDIVAVDAWATSLFGLSPHDVGFIPAMAAMGLGTMTPKPAQVRELTVS